MGTALPFSARLTAFTAVFACIPIAAPASTQGPIPPWVQQAAVSSAQLLTTDPATLNGLNLVYSQLTVEYQLFLAAPQLLTSNPALIAVPPLSELLAADPVAMFNANVAAAIASVTQLKSLLAGISVTGDNLIRLQGMQIIVSNALTNLQNVQANE